MNTLVYLDIRGCNTITDRGLVHLVAMDNLKHVLLGGCENITPAGVKDLKKRIPHCRVVKRDEMWEDRNQ